MHKLTLSLFERDRVSKLCKSDNVMSGLDLSPFFFFEGLNFNFTPISSIVGSHLYPSAVPDNFVIASSSLEPLVTNVLRDKPTLFNNLGIVPEELVLSDARKLKADSYVDDLHSGGSKADVSRMMGTKDPLTNRFTGTIPRLLNNVGLTLEPF